MTGREPDDPEDRALRAAVECLALLAAVVVLSVAVGIILDRPVVLVAGAIAGGGGALLVCGAVLGGMR